jgi:hypothetical protein
MDMKETKKDLIKKMADLKQLLLQIRDQETKPEDILSNGDMAAEFAHRYLSDKLCRNRSKSMSNLTTKKKNVKKDKRGHR